MNSQNNNNEKALPKGWKREEVIRKKGFSQGKIDVYIKSPKGKIFRSKKELLKYIGEKNLPYNIEDFNFSRRKEKSDDNLSDILSPSNSGSSDETYASLESESMDNIMLTNESFGNHETQAQASSPSKIKNNDCSTRASLCLSILNNDWLTDDSLQMYYELISINIIKQSSILLMNPIFSQAIKCLDDFTHILEDLHLPDKDHILIPVNDSEAVGMPGGSGSHWSLLYYNKAQSKFLYLDTYHNANYDHAKRIVLKMTRILQGTQEIDIVSVPQQINKFDCGIYVLLFTDVIVKHALWEKQIESWEQVIPASHQHILICKRSQLAMLYYNKHLNLGQGVLYDLLFCSYFLQKKSSLKGDAILPNPQNKTENKIAPIQPNGRNTPTHDEWQEVQHSTPPMSRHEAPPIVCKNRFDLLSEEQAEKEVHREDYTNKQHKKIYKQIKHLSKRTVAARNIEVSPKIPEVPVHKKKVMILADSHGRRCGESIQNKLGRKFMVESIIKPNAKFRDVVEGIERMAAPYGKDDYIIILAGINNFNDETPDLDFDLKNVNSVASKTNVLVPGIPLRFDKIGFRVNSLIRKVNLSIFEQISCLKLNKKSYVDVPKCKFTIEDHNRYGLHFNRVGKLKLINQIVLAIFRHSRCQTHELNLDANCKSLIQINQYDSHVEQSIQIDTIHFQTPSKIDTLQSQTITLKTPPQPKINNVNIVNDTLFEPICINTNTSKELEVNLFDCKSLALPLNSQITTILTPK